MKLRGRTRAWTAPAAVLSLLLLGGCGQFSPGTASVVNGTRISNDQVNDLADAQCVLRGTLAEAESAPATSAARVRQESLGLLMDAEFSQQFGRTEKISADKLLTQGFFDQVEPFFESLPKKARAEFTDVFQEWSQGRAILVQAGAESTGQQPTLENIEQLLNAGLQARDDFVKRADIDTDPRYAPDKLGLPGSGGDGSVSKASSSFARGGSAAELDAKWVTGLPASQKCG